MMNLNRRAAGSLKDIDGMHKSMIEFEEICWIRTLRRAGVKLAFDDAGVLHVDWTTVTLTA